VAGGAGASGDLYSGQRYETGHVAYLADHGPFGVRSSGVDRQAEKAGAAMRTVWFHVRRTCWTLHDLVNQRVIVEWQVWPPRARILTGDPRRREQVTR
jgi:hypothetical protein